ncbi:cardiolipin synthase [Opitutaceae bacterium EW11]|nr:cardiolipin synthase [Opitutaceae bacterium EW11]
MEYVRRFSEHPLLPHLLTVGGFILALFAIARILTERRQPSNTLAWLLVIVLIPYIGVPFYLIFGGRKLQKLVARKSRIYPSLEGTGVIDIPSQVSATAQTINASGAFPPVGGNTVRLITTGEHMYAALEQQIRAAKYSIHITTFILGRDETGKRIVKLLSKRAEEGVKVRLLLDAVGCLFSSRGFTDPLRRAGGEVQRFMPVMPFVTRSSANLRNHRKIAIFDQHTAIVGGHNLASEYMGPTPHRRRWRDFGAILSGPAATLLNEVFLADWSFASGQRYEVLHKELRPDAARSEGSSVLQVVASGPDVAGDSLYEGILSMIQEAHQSIWIITPYFIPDEVLWRSLMVKARAGIDVTLVLPDRSNHPITDFARRHYIRELKSAGARILLFGPGMMHSKGIIIDNRMGMLGSANFDLRSLFVNFEVGVVLYSENDVRAMRAWAEELMVHSRELKPERARRYRVIGHVAEDISRLLAPLL